MQYEAVDHIILPMADVDAAAARFERLGLRVSPGVRHEGMGTYNRVLWVGGRFYVELLGIADEQEAESHPTGAMALQAVRAGRGAWGVLLRTTDLQGTLRELAGRGLQTQTQAVTTSDGTKICDAAFLASEEQAAFNVAYVQYAASGDALAETAISGGALDHRFPLKRLDHLAAVTHELEATTRYWNEVLGVPTAGEIRTPALIIRQLRVGDVNLELLGPASTDSPMRNRPPGMVSMAAFEVPDLAAAVAQARAAGFTVPEPATGVLPGTRTATIPAGELAGLALQLLEYVDGGSRQ